MFHTVYLFWVEILRNFKTVGALAPSSPALARAMLRPLARRPNRPIRVMEADLAPARSRFASCASCGREIPWI